MEYVNLSGKLLKARETAILYDNGTFRYGYGLFETILFINGSLQLKEYHWQRLFAGIKQLNFVVPVMYSNSWLEEQVHATIRKNNIGNLCRVRLQVYAGSGNTYSTTSQLPEFIIECFPLEEDFIALNETGMQVGVATSIAKSADSIANLKSCSALLYLMAAQQAKANEWNDALIKNTAGNIIESTIANLFIIKNNIIYTPPLQDGCIAGVMRRHIIDTLGKHGMEVIEKSLSESNIYDADELFLSNAIRRVKWVAGIGSRTFGNRYTKYISNLLFDINLQ